MRRNGYKTTSGVKFDLKFDFYVARFPICREILEIGPRFHVVFANFLLLMRRNGQNSTSGQIFNPKFEIPVGCFLFEYEFWWHFRQDLSVFGTKNGFRNAKFSEFGGWWLWGWPFLTKPPKGTSLADSTRFEPLCVQIRSRVLSLGDSTKKRDTTKSHGEVIFHLFAGNSPLSQI